MYPQQRTSEINAKRKETIERLFGTAKENHGFRYTHMVGKAQMEYKVGLTFSCMNLKKLATMLARTGTLKTYFSKLRIKNRVFTNMQRKMELGFA